MKFSKRSPLIILGTLLLSVGISYISHLCPLLAKSTPIVTTSCGQIQGRIGYSLRTGKEFWQFLSIPYAQPPLGKLRFEPPVPMEPWTGVKQVVKYPPHCLQYDALVMQKVQGNLDCLYLNVFVSSPKHKPAKLKPVLVFIHGGGFLSSGSRTYHPDFFMDQDDIILVTLNYRLGPFGFLNLLHNKAASNNTSLPRGNVGLKDQNLVLRWIQANIAAFGGNPSSVTIFGESAGGASVHLHMLSQQSRGLFHKAVALSGTAHNPWALSKDVKKISIKFAKRLGCPIGEGKEDKLLECLQNADSGEMVKLQQVLQEPTAENDLLIPSIEAVITEDTFLAEHPLEIVRRGGGAKIPLILGVNSGEGGLITARFDAMPQIIGKLEKIWRSKIAAFVAGSEDIEMSPDLLQKIRSYYFGNNDTFSSLDPFIFQENLSKMSSDSLFFIPTHKAAVEHARSGAPTYLYYYDYKAVHLPSTYSGFRAVTSNDWMFPWLKVVSTMIFDWIVEHIVGEHRGPRRFGISHAEDLYQAWNLEGMTGYFAGWDKEFSNGFVQMFVQFARDDKSPLTFRGVPWPALSSSEIRGADDKPLQCMLMDNSATPKMVPEPYADSLIFWTSLGIF